MAGYAYGQVFLNHAERACHSARRRWLMPTNRTAAVVIFWR
jgi:hypothetical protein